MADKRSLGYRIGRRIGFTIGAIIAGIFFIIVETATAVRVTWRVIRRGQ